MPVPSTKIIREPSPDQHLTLCGLAALLERWQDSSEHDLDAAIATVNDLMLRRPVDDGSEVIELRTEVDRLRARNGTLETALSMFRAGVSFVAAEERDQARR